MKFILFSASFFTILLNVFCDNQLRGLGEPFVAAGTFLPDDEWFTQKLDHFDPSNTQTWQQRYFTNASFLINRRNAPVFLQIGGEGEASPKWMVKGAWIEYAAKYGALCFQLEHRYYGKSHPTSDMSTENLKYLSSEQALADLAYFIEGMNEIYDLNDNNKWIVFGGSYSGSLAAWLRMKYPHLVHGAMSASGPLLAKADFREYFDVVRDSLGTSNANCPTAVQQAMKKIENLINSGKTDNIKQKFNLCEKLNVNKKNDVSNFIEQLSDIFAGVVQYNKDNRFTPSSTSNITIDDICEIMTDTSKKDPVDRLSKLNKMFLKLQNATCLDFNYQKSVEEMKKISWESSASEGGRQWTYQTCTEFGFYQTSSTSSDLFGTLMPVDFFIDQCKQIYGNSYNKALLDSGIQRTNTIYGDLHLRVSRVVFVHGSIDPWHALGILSTNLKDSFAIYIDGTAHCANMYPSSDDDPPQLKQARQKISTLIGKWLMTNDYY